MEAIRKLPVGIQSFEDLRRKKFIYVDKTKYIWLLTQTGKTYFLSRPRRFGKSLLISTMEAYFQGKRDLFEGLAISEWENARGEEAWRAYPVIRFSLSGGSYHGENGLADRLTDVINSYINIYDLSGEYAITGETLPVRFLNLIKNLYLKTGRQVVVLVDEYDKPLLETADKIQEQKNRDLYKGFFSILKDQDEYLKFVFFTGVTKFSKVSIFSDLNQLEDISLSDDYADICGITEEEMEVNFQPEIERLAKTQELSKAECVKKLSRTYDGYHFSKKAAGVFNPFSLLSAFKNRDFDRYWFETGTPTFLIKKLQSSDFRPEQFVDGVESTEAELKDYRTENPNPIPLFYQAGYLTISGYDRRFGLYSLKFPNEEVRYGFLNSLVPYVLGEKDSEHSYSAKAIVLALEQGDTHGLENQLYSLFASIPYMEGNAIEYESVWRNQIYLIFALLGQYIQCEQHTAKGRCDCVIQTEYYIWLFEFKMKERGTAQKALEQIEEKDYAGRFRADKRKIIKVGAVFSEEKRNIEKWETSSQTETKEHSVLF